MKKSVSYNDIKLFITGFIDWTYRTNALKSMENLISYMLIEGVIDEDRFKETVEYRKKFSNKKEGD